MKHPELIQEIDYFNNEAFKVFFNKEIIVIGPTPPGTGVIYEHLGATSSKRTSPASLKPVFVSASTLVIPTSITTAPSFTISPLRKPGTPSAAIIISAFSVCSFRFLVRLWHIVTVQSPGFAFNESKFAIGFPTILLRPIITQCFPDVSTPYLISSSNIPAGVADINEGRPRTILPTFTGWKPSTSFLGSIDSITFCSSICLGKGNCTIRPSTELLLLIFSISSRRSF